MLWYAQSRLIGALLIECRQDFGIWPLWRVDQFGDERIINLPYIQIVLTPYKRLQQEHHIMTSPGKLTSAQTDLFLELLHQLEQVDPEFPLNYSICLGQIAKAEGLSLTQLSERTGLALSTVSRIVGALSNFRQNGQSYGLVELRVAEAERRRKELYLTPKGWMVMKSIGNVLENYRPADVAAGSK